MKKIILITVAALVFTACSLKYDETVKAEETNPELVFTNTKITRYEDNKITVEVQAGTIEQYKNSSSIFAKDISFITYDKNKNIDTKGTCGLLNADTDNNIYELFNDIRLFNASQKINFSANMLKWNGDTEQLTGGRSDTVKVEKDNTVIYGSGFSASGVSRRFVFTGSVSGDIETKNQADEVQENQQPDVPEENLQER